MSADDLSETLAAIKSRNDFGEAYQDDVDALLSAVEGVLALCAEYDRDDVATLARKTVAERFRKALTDALRGA